jgi:valyl-tRNA synthetase
LQDTLIRYYRMKGRPTLWVPGTDHAGIATQSVMEKRLAKEGKTRQDLGREEFVRRTWELKEEHHTIITKQLKKLGASVDWSRERFTMDEGLSKAVKEVFVKLHEKGLVYKSHYLVNWDPGAQTAVSDDEVDYKEINGALYKIQYPLVEGAGYVTVETTRPETMLGDTAVAVHPEDERFSELIGQKVKLPLTDREIPIITDSYVDREFGTGAVKITPGHDPNDYEMGKRHGLEMINILNPDATLNENVPVKYQGMHVKKARKAVVEDLEEQGFFLGQTPHKHQVGHCYRSGEVIEPYLSEQWFVKMKPLAEKALEAWKDGQIQFYPKKWENTYSNWLEGIRDWCISRQLWWGHQIPAWYDNAGNTYVGRSEEEVREKHGLGDKTLTQDEDVLDTWFSSWLWPFSTLGWPEKTTDLSQFYPNTALVTGYDIIFFWVARMVMAGLEFLGEVPFKDIYMHQLVRDKKGRKMSKTLGNGIDPLEVIEEYGADAMKFTLVYLSAQGQDILMNKETFKFGSKFANKVWNASRYILMNLPEVELLPQERWELKPIDKWILHRFNETVTAVDKAMEAYRFNDVGHAVYEFFWNDFCDWYIEASKIDLYSKDAAAKLQAASKLTGILELSLHLMQPFLSFITEEIYHKLPGHRLSLVNSPFPMVNPSWNFPQEGEDFGTLQSIVSSIRTLRSEFTIGPEKKIKIALHVEEGNSAKAVVEAQVDLIKALAGASEVSFLSSKEPQAGAVAQVGKGWEAYVFIRDVIDLDKQLAKMKKDLAKYEKLVSGTEKKLANKNFVENAPAEVVAHERAKMAEFEETILKLGHHIKDLMDAQ